MRQNKDVKSVIEQGLRPLVNRVSFGHLVKLILEARTAEKPNPFVGTWKFLPERSHFDRTSPKDITLRFVIEKGELREEEEVVLSNGSRPRPSSLSTMDRNTLSQCRERPNTKLMQCCGPELMTVRSSDVSTMTTGWSTPQNDCLFHPMVKR